jgi:hypothetical protein
MRAARALTFPQREAFVSDFSSSSSEVLVSESLSPSHTSISKHLHPRWSTFV